MEQYSLFALQYGHLAVVAAILAYACLSFVRQFLLPARELSKELDRAIVSLAALRGQTDGHITELGEIAETMVGPSLSHPWSEYAKTLHAQRSEDASGHSRIVRWRATALAESFFTDQSVVDTRLKVEFFKHLPGLLTGTGIIGTFSGLIIGLNQFSVRNPGDATDQVKKLVESVAHAFYVSAAAIFLAMLSTWIEKYQLASRYRQLEELRRLVDGLFEVGAGEEYLERLVAASEISATQAAQIKDALVADLREILSSLTAQQIAAHSAHTGQISGDVGRAIVANLGDPMREIAEAVKGVSANQGDAVNRLLTDVLASFSAQMKDLFGGQMEGLTQLLIQTGESMKATAQQFDKLAANMSAAGTGTVDAMNERLKLALDAIDGKQQSMNQQMGQFVEQIRGIVSDSQNQSSRQVQVMLSAIGEQVTNVVEQLRSQSEAAVESHNHRQDRLEKRAGDAISNLTGQMENLLGQSIQTNIALQKVISELTSANDKAIADMRSGAEAMSIAASEFAKAGQGVSNSLHTSTAAVESIKAATSEFSSASNTVKGVVDDYARTRDTFAKLVSDLKLTVENSRRDASMTSELISRLEGATTQLARAQKQSEEYLQGVSDVLVKAHEAFAQNVERTLREGNRKFQGELSGAVELLSGAIRNLGDVLDDVPSKK